MRKLSGAAWVIGCLTAALCQQAWTAATSAADVPEAFRTKFDRELAPSVRPTLICTRVDRPPTIDGEVDQDPVWRSCAPTHGAWAQLARREPSGRQTVTYACYDARNLYLAFVCEEPDLQAVHMDGALTEAGKPVGPDDCAEAILEVGGTQGDGQVYSFRANTRGQATAWGLAGIPPTGGYHTPVWTSAGKFGPNRWMVEMAIPFATLKRRPEQPGLPAPSRGDVLGLKLVRYGAKQADPRSRMVSTWNTDIASPLVYVAGGNGLLYFEDANALIDGSFAQPDGASLWKRAGDVSQVAGQAGLTLGPGATLSQTVAVHPSSYYLLRVDGQGTATITLTVDRKALALKDGQAGTWTADKQDKATVAISAAEPVTLKTITMEYQPGEEPPGACCLTNNYRRPDRNVRALLPGAPDGQYQYVAIDYMGRVTADINPAIKVNQWSFDYNMRVEDLGGRAGWVPFAKGSLTGRPEPIFWQTENPGDNACWGRHTQVIDVDLGQEYYVTGLDVLWPAQTVSNLEIWAKVKADDEWTYLYTGDGAFVAPDRRRTDRRSYQSVRALDSVARYVRWRAVQPNGEWSYPQMDGIQEMWVWGQPKGEHVGIKPFKPWVPDKIVPPVKGQTAALDPDAALIVPRPRQLTRQDGWFVINPQTRLVAQGRASARQVAQQIRAEVLERWGIDLTITPEPQDAAAAPPVENAIYVGVAQASDAAKRLADSDGLAIDPAKPQGYGLRVTPQHVTVLGRDDEGLYYGVQSLMMALRWRGATDPAAAGPACRAMTVIDYPGTLERSIYNHKGYAAILNLPVSEIPRIKRLCRLLSRFKYNAIYVNPTHSEGEGQAWAYAAYGWPKGTMAEVCREIRDECHVEIRPILLTSEGMGGNWWRSMLTTPDDLAVTECDPDESPDDLGPSLNVCPLDPRTYELGYAKIDQALAEFGHPGKVWLWGQVYGDSSYGARWAVCRRCQRSGKTPEDLYAYFLDRIAGHLDQQGTRGLLVSPWLRYADRDPRDRRRIAMDFRQVPPSLVQSLPDLSDNSAGEAALLQAIRPVLPPARCANGPRAWPSGERHVRGPWTETEILVNLAGADIQWGGTSVFSEGGLADQAEVLWYSPDSRPPGRLDATDLGAWIYGWWFGRELPGWRAGAHPPFIPLDLRPLANHDGRATGTETLEPGRPPEIDLRYLPKGHQTLGNVEFDIIDPATNGGRSILMMGRPPKSVLPKVTRTICEQAGPIPVGRKLASLAFLRARWQCTIDSGMHWSECWLRPTCRVVYDDGSWLVVDAFQHPVEGFATEDWDSAVGLGLYYRLGWGGNCPGGQSVGLSVVEWVNPYPERTVAAIDLFTPDFDQRVNRMCEAIVAITGIEPVDEDFRIWSRRTDRPPLLPPRSPPSDPAHRLKPLGEVNFSAANEARRLDGQLVRAGGPDKVPYTLALADKTLLFAAEGAYRKDSFAPLVVTLTFASPLHLGRVDLLGPHHNYGNVGPREQRLQKIDVTVEVSADGRTWQPAGQVRGASADADFQPVDLPANPIRALRLTGSADAYRALYHPAQFWGGMFNTVGNSPHFSWRLFAPPPPRGRSGP